MKNTIIAIGLATLSIGSNFPLAASTKSSNLTQGQNSSKGVEINDFSFKFLGCQLNHTGGIFAYGISNNIGTLCNIEIKNKQNSPRILRYHHDLAQNPVYGSSSSHFSDTSGYLHPLVGCGDSWKSSGINYCQNTFQANESKILSTQSDRTAIKKNDSLNIIVLMFDLLEASGRKRFEAIFNKNNTGEILVTSDAPIVYAENAKAQDTVQQEVKVEELKFQLLYCQNIGKDIGFDGIEDGVCEFKVTNTSNTAIGLAGHSRYGDAIDLGGNKHLFGGFRLNGYVSLNYKNDQYFVELPNFKNNPPIDGYSSEKIYPGVTVRGAVSVKNIFPDNTAFRKLNLVLKTTKNKKEKEISVVFRAKNIPILPAK